MTGRGLVAKWAASPKIKGKVGGSGIAHRKGHVPIEVSGFWRTLLLAGALCGATTRCTSSEPSLPDRGITRLGDGLGIAESAFVLGNKDVVAACQDGVVRFLDLAGKEVGEPLKDGQRLLIDWVVPSKDGRLLAAVSRGHRGVRIWDVSRRKALHDLGTEFEIATIAFSPDGRLLAAAGDTWTAVWDLSTGRQEWCLPLHNQWIWGASFSCDGKKLATAGEDGSVVIVASDLLSAEPQRIHLKRGPVRCVAFSPTDPGMLALGSLGLDVLEFGSRANIHVWNLKEGKEKATLVVGDQVISSLAFDVSGKLLACGGYGKTAPLMLWDVAKGKKIRDFPMLPQGVSSVSFSPSGKTLVSAGSALHFWDTASGKELAAKQGHEGYISNLGYTPDGRALVTLSNQDRTLRFWDPKSGRLTKTVKEPELWTGLAFAPDMRFFVTGGASGVLLWDAQPPRPWRTVPLPQATTRAVRFSPTGDLYGVGTLNHGLFICSVYEKKPVASLRAGDVNFGSDFEFISDNQVIVRERFELTLWDLAKGTKASWASRLTRGGALALSADRRILATHLEERTVGVWDVKTARLIKRIATPEDCPIVLLPDGKLLVTVGYEGNGNYNLTRLISVWEIATGKRWLEIQQRGHFEQPRLAFSPDHRALATAVGSAAIVWNIAATANTKASMTKEALEKRWQDLAGMDSALAHDAVWEVVGWGDEALPFLAAKIRRLSLPDTKMYELVSALDDPNFKARTRAETELAKLGPVVEPLLRRRLESASEEMKRRLGRVLPTYQDVVPAPEILQGLRLVMILERISSENAITLLRAIAARAADLSLGEEAQSAVERLRRRRAYDRGRVR
jgi:WD40 repeat protein